MQTVWIRMRRRVTVRLIQIQDVWHSNNIFTKGVGSVTHQNGLNFYKKNELPKTLIIWSCGDWERSKALIPGIFLFFLIRLGIGKIKFDFFLLNFPAFCHMFSMKSLILKLATAVDDHDIYTGHSILFVHLKIVDGWCQSYFSSLRWKIEGKIRIIATKMHLFTIFLTIPKLKSKKNTKIKNFSKDFG